MNDLDQALHDIVDVRRQIARSTEFRGYGPAASAVIGLLAFAAGAIQARLGFNPETRPASYFALWMATATVSAGLAAVEMFARSKRAHSMLANDLVRVAVEQFLPALAAGGLVAVVLVWVAPERVAMLPGLWQIIFSLGVFASCRFLPRSMVVAGAWYLLTGLLLLSLDDARALGPWAMAIPFGIGQLLVAAILQSQSEKR